MFQAQNRETINRTLKVAVSFKIIMMTSVTRSCFTKQHQNCKTKTDFWSQTGLILRPTVSDHITEMEGIWCLKVITQGRLNQRAHRTRALGPEFFSFWGAQGPKWLCGKFLKLIMSLIWCFYYHTWLHLLILHCKHKTLNVRKILNARRLFWVWILNFSMYNNTSTQQCYWVSLGYSLWVHFKHLCIVKFNMSYSNIGAVRWVFYVYSVAVAVQNRTSFKTVWHCEWLRDWRAGYLVYSAWL